ncbi:hypothetical protein IGI04_015676 [Brassica rapa subsp. trilocularis]|uniref:Uncharacterized protein n=1 Tax=Brassica rapa subsp. trilocularis TaxID=1813537 RepID=A0ABQ7MU78_BRACM|nr:hypothetical protein IGI04_015676 [Brassica rapa subsp. trilocularis]
MSMKPNGKSIISSSDDNSDKKNGSNPLLSAAVKAKGKAHVSSDDNREVMFFNEISLGPQGDDLGTVIQGFVPPGRIKKFLPHMRQGSLYTLASFYGSRNKDGEDKKLKTQLASREKFYGKFLLSNLSTSKFQLVLSWYLIVYIYILQYPLLYDASRELMLLTPLMLVLSMFLCLPEFKHRHEEVKVDLAEACMIPCFSQSNSFPVSNLH